MKFKKSILCLILALVVVLTSCNLPDFDVENGSSDENETTVETQSGNETSNENDLVIDAICGNHSDTDDDGKCDVCELSVIVYVDLYAINDLHGKFCTTDTNAGVEGLTTYLKNATETDDHAVLLSSGDMWQGGAESNLTSGLIVTDWMNELDFSAMTLGNHEFDWGEEPIEDNAEFAEFPFLAINIYDRETRQQVSYCQSSVVFEADGIQIGVIGAMGDCYSSISPDKVADVYFVTGSQLTALVEAESARLRAEGVDFIVYAIHDGFGGSSGSTVKPIDSGDLAGYYDYTLSAGAVDLVFEGHTHQNYLLLDEYGVFHLQNGGDNKNGISHAAVSINTANGSTEVTAAELIPHSQYTKLDGDPIVEDLLAKYETQIGNVYGTLGSNAADRNRNFLRQLAADLYYEAGVKAWGGEYNIALAGGFFSVRSPGYLPAGSVTYAQLQTLFPFDNELALCKVQGRDLKSKFFESGNDNYFISYGDYGAQLKGSIDPDAVYYIVTDTYTAYYAPNNLEVVKLFGQAVYARDLLADYIAAGNLA